MLKWAAQAGGLPHLTEGVRAGADDPGGQERLKGLTDLVAEARTEGGYQLGQGREKLVHQRASVQQAIRGFLAEPRIAVTTEIARFFFAH
jgi:hypothetical protein